MATLYQNQSLGNRPAEFAGREDGYKGYIEPDTTVPPRARPVLSGISVNGVSIPEADVLAEAQNHPAETPGQALIAAARALAVRELLIQEAARSGINIAANEARGTRTEAPEDKAISLLIDREVHVPSAGKAECRRFYDNNRGRFCSEPIWEARHILLAAGHADETRRNAARAKAEALIAHLAARPEDFSVLAGEHSACSSRDQGGSLGQVTPGSTVAEFQRALETMHDGQLLMQPVATRFGYHVIFLERKIAGTELPFEHVADRIAGWLEAASWSKAVAQYISILAGRAEISGIDISSTEGPLIQ